MTWIQQESQTGVSSSSRRSRESSDEDPNDEVQPARKRRHVELVAYVKTEDEQQMFDRMLALW